MPEKLWARARNAVTAAVLAVPPRDAEDARCLASRMCAFLVGHPRWDRRGVPDLASLLTTGDIDAYVGRLLKEGRTSRAVGVQRSDLRRVAAAMSGARRRATSGRPSASQRLGAGAALFPLLVVGEAPLPAIRAWEAASGRRATPTALDPVVKAVHAAYAPLASDGTVPALIAAGDPAVEEVSPATPSRSTPPLAARTPRTTTSPRSSGKARTSAAGALRVARAAQAALEAPTVAPEPDANSLPLEAREAIETYRPQGVTRSKWEALRPLCRRLLIGFAPVSANQARSAASVITPFLVWASTRPVRSNAGPSLSPEALRAAGLADAYLMTLDVPDASKATYRSVLRRALKSLDPSPAPTLAYQPVAGPYTAAECAAFVRLARNQPSLTRRRELSALVGLSLGAGLDGSDLRDTRPDDIECLPNVVLTDGSLALAVRVRGERGRLVPIRAAYVPLIRYALDLHAREGRSKGIPLLGTESGRRTSASPTLSRAVTATGTGVDIAVSRLRATWLTACLAAGVPLGALLHAAGLRSARTLVDLLPYCPAPDEEAVARLLALLTGPAADATDGAR